MIDHPRGNIQIGRYLTATADFISDRVSDLLRTPDPDNGVAAGTLWEPLANDSSTSYSPLLHSNAYFLPIGSFVGDIEITDIPVPAILIDLERAVPADPSSDFADGGLALTLENMIYIIVAESDYKANLRARIYAIAVAAALHRQRIDGAPVGPAAVQSLEPVLDFHVQDHAYVAWSVSFHQDIFINTDFSFCKDIEIGLDETPASAHVGIYQTRNGASRSERPVTIIREDFLEGD